MTKEVLLKALLFSLGQKSIVNVNIVVGKCHLDELFFMSPLLLSLLVRLGLSERKVVRNI